MQKLFYIMHYALYIMHCLKPFFLKSYKIIIIFTICCKFFLQKATNFADEIKSIILEP